LLTELISVGRMVKGLVAFLLLANERGLQRRVEWIIWFPYAKVMKVQSYIGRYLELLIFHKVHVDGGMCSS